MMLSSSMPSVFYPRVWPCTRFFIASSPPPASVSAKTLAPEIYSVRLGSELTALAMAFCWKCLNIQAWATAKKSIAEWKITEEARPLHRNQKANTSAVLWQQERVPNITYYSQNETEINFKVFSFQSRFQQLNFPVLHQLARSAKLNKSYLKSLLHFKCNRHRHKSCASEKSKGHHWMLGQLKVAVFQYQVTFRDQGTWRSCVHSSGSPLCSKGSKWDLDEENVWFLLESWQQKTFHVLEWNPSVKST